jgi:hypothetical protein
VEKEKMKTAERKISSQDRESLSGVLQSTASSLAMTWYTLERFAESDETSSLTDEENSALKEIIAVMRDATGLAQRLGKAIDRTARPWLWNATT